MAHLETNSNDALAVIVSIIEQPSLQRSIPIRPSSHHGRSKGVYKRGFGWLTLRGRRHPSLHFPSPPSSCRAQLDSSKKIGHQILANSS